MSSRSHVISRLIPSCVLTCVIFTCSQTSHVTHHVIYFDLSTNHMTSHVIDPDAQHPMPALPLWNTDTITELGHLPNQDVGLTSYSGITPV